MTYVGKGKRMTVQELIDQLNAIEDKTRIVIMQGDGEGTSYSPLDGVYSDTNYQAETTWSGRVCYAELTPELEDAGYSEEDILSDAAPAAVLVPMN